MEIFAPFSGEPEICRSRCGCGLLFLLFEVFDFLMRNKDKIPRIALRYAIEKYPDNLRKKAMRK
jgi:hypothetical protein